MEKSEIEDYINKLENIHGNKYNYSETIFKTKLEKIEILCKEHGIFKQQLKMHLQGQGCPKCAIDNRALKRKISFEEFVEKAHKMHNNKFEYIKESYTKASDFVKINCFVHGYFSQRGLDHLKGKGCKQCGVEKRVKNRKMSVETFIEKSNERYDYKFDYSKVVYENCDTHCTIICPKHGEYLQTPYLHLIGKFGCPSCAVEFNSERQRLLPKELSKLKKNFSRRAKLFLRKNKNIRKGKEYVAVLGCEWFEFKEFLEDNPYGFKVGCEDLDLDHIVPICRAVDEESFYKLNHYTNFQLLPSVYNQVIKRAKDFDREGFERWLKETEYNKC